MAIKISQPDMFPSGEDLPLFSGAVRTVHMHPFAPREELFQMSTQECRVCFDTGRIVLNGNHEYCLCPAGAHARVDDRNAP